MTLCGVCGCGGVEVSVCTSVCRPTCMLFVHACMCMCLVYAIEWDGRREWRVGRRQEKVALLHMMLHVPLQVTTMPPLTTSMTASLECSTSNSLGFPWSALTSAAFMVRMLAQSGDVCCASCHCVVDMHLPLCVALILVHTHTHTHTHTLTHTHTCREHHRGAVW